MLDERKKAFEKEFAVDEEIDFKAKAMASKLFGNWASDVMGMNAQDSDLYVKNLIELSINNNDYDKVIQYVQNNLKNLGKNFNKTELENIFLEKLQFCKDKLEH